MTRDQINLSRSDLYELVWQTPISRLAKEYGISDVGLKKICVRHRIPVPGLGYWAKLRAGRNLPKQPLPNLPKTELDLENISIHRTEQSRIAQVEKLMTHPELAAVIARESDPIYQIAVPERLASPHPLVLHAKSRLKEQRPFTYGRVKTIVVPGVSINVSPAAVDRACRIMDTIFKALLKRGYEIRESERRGLGGGVLILDQKIDFKILEKVIRHDYLPTKEELKRARALSWEPWQKYFHEPTGMLNVQIESYALKHGKVWSDHKNIKLESKLIEFLIGLANAAIAERERQLERERSHREWEEEEQKRRKQEALRQQEEKRKDLLLQDADDLARAQQVRSFIAQVCAQSMPSAALDAWVDWAGSIVKSLDPLTNFIPSRYDISEVDSS